MPKGELLGIIAKKEPFEQPKPDQIPKFTDSSERPGDRTTEIFSRTLFDWETQCASAELATRSTLLNPSVANNVNSAKLLGGPITNWRRFREYLMTLGTEEKPKLERITDFIMQPAIEDEHLRAYDLMNYKSPSNPISAIESELPPYLASWVASSRRTFSIPPHLQQMFINDNYGDLTWEDDLPLPFNGFAIEMNPPLWLPLTKTIAGTTGYFLESMIVTIIKYDDEEDPLLCARVFVSDKDRKIVRDYTREDRKAIETALDKKGSDMAQGYVDWGASRPKNFSVHPPIHLYIKPKGLIEEFEPDEHPLSIQLKRIIAGCCLHLAYYDQGPASVSLPPQTSKVLKGKKKRLDPRQVISDQAKVFVLQGVNVQAKTPADQLDEPGGRTVAPHWRRGYLRKERNSPPGSPKTEWVRPTKVNAHLMLPGTLPRGTATVLSQGRVRKP